VTNIKRAAQILNGTTIAAGATFSLNPALGRRTLARGFVPAPQISDGLVNDGVGGGISQVATTMYNAAFFAGLRLNDHHPHQFYISRYPMGREATISWGGPELAFTNDWPARLRMRLVARNSSITIAFISASCGRHVTTTTGHPYNFVRPITRYLRDPSLPRGVRKVIQQAGGPGFDIDYTRRVYRNRALKRDERFHVRYQPEDAFIVIGEGRR
jgi:vancomycin resistance protein YoaR